MTQRVRNAMREIARDTKRIASVRDLECYLHANGSRPSAYPPIRTTSAPRPDPIYAAKRERKRRERAQRSFTSSLPR